MSPTAGQSSRLALDEAGGPCRSELCPTLDEVMGPTAGEVMSPTKSEASCHTLEEARGPCLSELCPTLDEFSPIVGQASSPMLDEAEARGLCRVELSPTLGELNTPT